MRALIAILLVVLIGLVAADLWTRQPRPAGRAENDTIRIEGIPVSQFQSALCGSLMLPCGHPTSRCFFGSAHVQLVYCRFDHGFVVLGWPPAFKPYPYVVHPPSEPADIPTR